MRIFGLCLACVALAACGDAGSTDPDPPPVDPVAEVTAKGPWAVGYAQREVVYDVDGVAEGRTLRLAVWYPTDAGSGEAVRYLGVFEAGPDVLGGAPPAAGPFPVALFSHGHMAYAEGSSFLARHLASHGWIVAAPDHTDNTLFDGPARQTPIYLQRPHDLSAALDALLSLPATDPLAGAIDGSTTVAMGHSFGGYTVHALAGAAYSESALACPDASTPFCSTMTPEHQALLRGGFGDPRFAAFVSLAPGDHALFGAGLADIERPLLVMTGGLDEAVGDDADPIWADLDGPDDLRVHLPRGGHNTFSDFAGVLDPDGVVEPGVGWRIVDAYVLAWLRRHALGDARMEPILDGTAPIDEAEVALTVR